MSCIEFGSRIKNLRLAKGITQTDLADILYVTPQAISKWERGLSYPDISSLPQIAKYFEVSIDTLFNYR